jgi:hypothetical protein
MPPLTLSAKQWQAGTILATLLNNAQSAPAAFTPLPLVPQTQIQCVAYAQEGLLAQEAVTCVSAMASQLRLALQILALCAPHAQ